jgi:hypothetical protein
MRPLLPVDSTNSLPSLTRGMEPELAPGTTPLQWFGWEASAWKRVDRVVRCGWGRSHMQSRRRRRSLDTIF